MCGTPLRDALVLKLILRSGGSWEIIPHQGHIVKIIPKGPELTPEEFLERMSKQEER